MRTFHPNCFYRNNSGFTRSSILPRTAHSSPTMQDMSRRRHHIKRLHMESFLLFAFISLQIIVNKNRYGRTANPPSYGQAKRRSRQILRPHTDKTIV